MQINLKALEKRMDALEGRALPDESVTTERWTVEPGTMRAHCYENPARTGRCIKDDSLSGWRIVEDKHDGE